MWGNLLPWQTKRKNTTKPELRHGHGVNQVCCQRKSMPGSSSFCWKPLEQCCKVCKIPWDSGSKRKHKTLQQWEMVQKALATLGHEAGKDNKFWTQKLRRQFSFPQTPDSPRWSNKIFDYKSEHFLRHIILKMPLKIFIIALGSSAGGKVHNFMCLETVKQDNHGLLSTSDGISH